MGFLKQETDYQEHLLFADIHSTVESTVFLVNGD